MTDPISEALDAAGLTGWRGSIRRHPESEDRIAVLHSPDYDPARGLGRMVCARAADADKAVADATAAALQRISQ